MSNSSKKRKQKFEEFLETESLDHCVKALWACGIQHPENVRNMTDCDQAGDENCMCDFHSVEKKGLPTPAIRHLRDFVKRQRVSSNGGGGHCSGAQEEVGEGERVDVVASGDAHADPQVEAEEIQEEPVLEQIAAEQIAAGASMAPPQVIQVPDSARAPWTSCEERNILSSYLQLLDIPEARWPLLNAFFHGPDSTGSLLSWLQATMQCDDRMSSLLHQRHMPPHAAYVLRTAMMEHSDINVMWQDLADDAAVVASGAVFGAGTGTGGGAGAGAGAGNLGARVPGSARAGGYSDGGLAEGRGSGGAGGVPRGGMGEIAHGLSAAQEREALRHFLYSRGILSAFRPLLDAFDAAALRVGPPLVAGRRSLLAFAQDQTASDHAIRRLVEDHGMPENILSQLRCAMHDDGEEDFLQIAEEGRHFWAQLPADAGAAGAAAEGERERNAARGGGWRLQDSKPELPVPLQQQISPAHGPPGQEEESGGGFEGAASALRRRALGEGGLRFGWGLESWQMG